MIDKTNCNFNISSLLFMKTHKSRKLTINLYQLKNYHKIYTINLNINITNYNINKTDCNSGITILTLI